MAFLFSLATKRSFIRRTKSTAIPDRPDTEPADPDIEVSTSKYTRRGNFKPRRESTTEAASEKIVGEKIGEKGGKTRPSLNTGGARSERPPRNFVRRRLGGANGTSTTSTSTTASPASSSATSRRPFRVAARRRPLASTTTTTTSTTETPTTTFVSEEYLQDIGDTDIIEEPSFERPNRTKVQRRPLFLKEETVDQNPSATNEEERKRHSKKYSASFKQNQLDEVLKKRAKDSQEVVDDTTEGMLRTTIEEFSPETALAIAAHQLLSAPLPSIPNYDDESKPVKKSTKLPSTTFEYKYTSPTYNEEYTDTKIYDDLSSTPIYKTTIGNQDFVQTTTGTVYDITTSFNSPRTLATSTFTPKTSTNPSSRYTARVSRPAAFTTANILTTLRQDTSSEFSRNPNPTSDPGFTRQTSLNPSYSRVPQSTTRFGNIPSTARYVSTSEKLIPVPVEDYSITTGAYSSIGQEPSYFTREYLLESPVTKTYDDVYQYLSPTTPQSTTRKIPKKIAYRRISTTIRPTIPSYVPEVTPPTPRRVPAKKPFEKLAVPKASVPHKYRPVDNYDYYDDGAEKLAEKYAEGTKVVLHAKGTIECLDIGNFPSPSSCKKFISCARLENGSLLGWEYICPKGLSFDPVGGICNWSAGLGCNEKDV